MVKTGSLDKYGRANEKTPGSWKQGYVDYSVPGSSAAPSTIPVRPFPTLLS